MLEHYHLLIGMMLLTSLAILLKCMCAIKYQMLIKEVEQISSSKNHILRSMLTKYESCFKLQLPVKNTESFIKVYQENFRFLGIPLKSLESFDLFCGFVVFCIGLLNIMGGIYYKLPAQWILIQVMTFSIFLVFLGMSEFVFQTRKKGALLTLHLTHYFDNTLYTKFFQKYIQPKEHMAYLQEYFEPLQKEKGVEKKQSFGGEKPTATLEKQLSPDMQELVESLMEESEITALIQEKRKQLAYASSMEPSSKGFHDLETEEKGSLEKYQLVEEIMKEYL